LTQTKKQRQKTTRATNKALAVETVKKGMVPQSLDQEKGHFRIQRTLGVKIGGGSSDRKMEKSRWEPSKVKKRITSGGEGNRDQGPKKKGTMWGGDQDHVWG